MAKRKPLVNEAEYVVVGAGSAGSAVASRLAQAGHTVVLLEAGRSDHRQFMVSKPGMIGPMHSVPQAKAPYDWGYYTVPQRHANNRRIPQTRGKVLGGSSSVNGMLWVRGNRANYDAWAAEGNTGWDADSVNAVYKRIEDFEDGEDAWRGAGGPIRVTRHTDPTEATHQFIQSTADTLGVKVLADYNGESQEGVGIFQQSVDRGLRYSSSRGYLTGRDLPTLSVQTRVHVARVVIRDGRATGVEVIDADGSRRTIHAAREVVVSAGVFGSPQVLMLSGVGPADHLDEHGLAVRADLPVGDNLHDHLFVPLTYHVDNAPHRGTAAYFARGLAREVLRPGTSFLANSVFESTAFVRTSMATDVPDLQLHLLPWAYPSPNQDAPIRHEVDPRTAVTVMSTLIYPRSRGTVRLATNDPRSAPLIDFNYLAEPEDRKVLLEGVAMIREIMGGAAFGGHVKSEIHPGPALGPREMEREVFDRATTVYHGVGSCRMGVDERAVVDPQLRVRGIEGLRVADASVMPAITGGNTNAPSIMIGDRCAELILSEN